MKAYLAGPWFTPEQDAILEQVKTVLINNNVDMFSPKDENLFKPGMSPDDVVNANLEAIRQSNIIVAITDGKDVGTIFEAGYAYAYQIPILYVWIGYKPGMKFNIMLAATGGVATSYTMLEEQIIMFKLWGKFGSLNVNENDYE